MVRALIFEDSVADLVSRRYSCLTEGYDLSVGFIGQFLSNSDKLIRSGFRDEHFSPWRELLGVVDNFDVCFCDGLGGKWNLVARAATSTQIYLISNNPYINEVARDRGNIIVANSSEVYSIVSGLAIEGNKNNN